MCYSVLTKPLGNVFFLMACVMLDKKKKSVRKVGDEGIIEGEYGGLVEVHTKCVGVEILLFLSIFTLEMQRRLKMTVIHVRLSCIDRYAK